MYKGEVTNMWKLIELKGPPTRLVRYCCKVLKETAAPNRLISLGVRAKESKNRRIWDSFEIVKKDKRNAKRFSYDHAKEVYEEAQVMPEVYDCTLITRAKENGKLACNPIIHWSDGDVWDYIRERESSKPVI